jgi:uncharacterized protein with HEPN domain
MLAAIDRVVEATGRVTLDEFNGDWVIQDAIVHELQVLGEAAGRVSRDFTDRHPEIPWRKVTGLRHKIVHDYFAIDLQVVWDTATLDVPAIRPIVQTLYEKSADKDRTARATSYNNR